jgi:hypothetical protein
MSGELEKRASDAEREQVVVRLRDASAEGRLTLEELADRAALAYRAQSHVELARLTEDLPVQAQPASRRKPVRWSGVLIGEVSRKGRWRIADRTTVVMGIGDCELDLRQAEVDVELSGMFLIGDKSLTGSEEEVPPGAPRIRVRVFGLIGDLKVVRR